MMNLSQSRKWMAGILCAGGLVLALLSPLGARAADYGRINGSVSDSQGNPLMGATVVIGGPLFNAFQPVGSAMERVITDAHGRFAIERLVPGWYSLKVTSATRLPVMRNGVRVEAGRSVEENFVLSDLLAPLLLAGSLRQSVELGRRLEMGVADFCLDAPRAPLPGIFEAREGQGLQTAVTLQPGTGGDDAGLVTTHGAGGRPGNGQCTCLSATAFRGHGSAGGRLDGNRWPAVFHAGRDVEEGRSER